MTPKGPQPAVTPEAPPAAPALQAASASQAAPAPQAAPPTSKAAPPSQAAPAPQAAPASKAPPAPPGGPEPPTGRPPAPLTDSLRDSFPLLAANPDLAYLDNAATTQKPRAVIDAVDSYYRSINANVHRALYGLAEHSTEAFENARRTVAGFIGAAHPREVIFTRGTTEALNLAAFSLGELLLEPGDIVLTSTLEHHSNFVPWQQTAARKSAELLLIPLLPDASLDWDFLRTIEADGRADRVKIAALGHVSNAFGTVHPVRRIAEWCRERSVPLVLDATQAIPHLHMEAQFDGADLLAFSGHKVYGPMGSGVLWGREQWLERMPPWQTGGEMISMVKPEKTTWNELPHKFEAGTPDVAAAVGLAAALRWLTDIGFRRIEDREAELSRYAAEKLRSIDSLTLYGPENPQERRGVFSFNLEGIHSHDIAQFLDRDQVAVRSGHHCAQPAMRSLGIPSTARASIAPYNLPSDIDRLIESLGKVQRYFGL